jgi:hypothetical protein
VYTLIAVLISPAMPPAHPEPTSAAPAAAGEDDGVVDLTLVDEMLAMTVRERLEQNDRTVRSINRLRAGFAALAQSNDGNGYEALPLDMAVIDMAGRPLHEAVLRRR